MAAIKVCAVDGCGKPAKSRGWCQGHYTRWQRHGDTSVVKVGGKVPTIGCSVADCQKPHASRGFCDTHYARWLKHGSAEATWTEFGEPLAWLKAHASHSDDGCLTWPFARYSDGRCAIKIDGRTVHATPVMCTEAHGPAPTPAHEAAHSCGKGHEGCINPGHLRWATHAENMADKLIHDTHNRGERHGMAKLTEEDVREIRRLARHMSHEEIAPKFNISRPYVGEIVSGKTWGWLA